MAIVEVCGFNDWFLKLLAEYGCREIVLVQPEKRSKVKTDRRDAAGLGELLWTNRQRIQEGKKVQNVRRIVPPSQRDAEDRQLTAAAATARTTADTNDQPHPASTAKAQLAAGMSDEEVANEIGAEMADDVGARHDGPFGVGSSFKPMGALRQAACGVSIRKSASDRRRARPQ